MAYVELHKSIKCSHVQHGNYALSFVCFRVVMVNWIFFFFLIIYTLKLNINFCVTLKLLIFATFLLWRKKLARSNQFCESFLCRIALKKVFALPLRANWFLLDFSRRSISRRNLPECLSSNIKVKEVLQIVRTYAHFRKRIST